MSDTVAPFFWDHLKSLCVCGYSATLDALVHLLTGGRWSFIGADRFVLFWLYLNKGSGAPPTMDFCPDCRNSHSTLKRKKNAGFGGESWHWATLVALLCSLTGGRQSFTRTDGNNPGRAGGGRRSGHAAASGRPSPSWDLWTWDHCPHHAQGQDSRPVQRQQAPGLPFDRADCSE